MGEPLYQDVVNALVEEGGLNGKMPKVIGGRYGLSFQGIYPRDGQGRFRRAQKAPAQEPFHRRHQRRRLPHQPRIRSGLLDRVGQVIRAMFYGLGATARWAPTRTRSRSSRGHAQLRAGLFRVRLEKIRVDYGFPPAFRARTIRSSYLISRANFVGCHQFSFCSRLDRAELAGRGRYVPAQQPLQQEETWTACRAASRGDHPPQGPLLRHRRLTPWRARRA